MGNYRIQDLIDISQLQSLMDYFYRASSIPVGILDTEGNILVATGWQDLCTKFHRVHPETLAKCKISDDYIKSNLQVGRYIEYKCQNNLWDLATPIVIKGRHVATLFLGQFFYDAETVDTDFFRQQANRYGFEENPYLEALKKVPVFSRQKVRNIMDYYVAFVQLLINTGLSHLELMEYQANLEKMVDERTASLQAVKNELEDEVTVRKAMEENVTAERNRLMGIIEAVEDGVYIVNRNYDIEYINPVIRREFGAVNGRKCHQYFHDRAEPCPWCKNPAVFSGKSVRWEWYSSKNRRYYDLFDTPIRNVDGTVSKFEIFHDITEHKKTLEALRESEERYRQLFHASNAVEILVDPETGKLADANNAACRFYGHPREVMVSKSIYEINTLTRAEINVEMEAAKTEKRNYFNFRHRLASGEVRDVEVYSSPVTVGGKPLLHSIVHDITERIKSERLLRCRAELSDLAATASVDELIQSGLDAAERLTASRIGYFHFVDDDQENLTLQTWSTNTLANMCKAEGKGMHYPISKAGVWVDCFHQKKPVIHNDYAALPHKKGMPEGHAPVIRELSIPVMLGGKVVAIMGVGNKETDYTADDVESTMEAASILFDLIQRKRAEDALRASGKRLEEAQRMAKVGNWEWDIATGANIWSDEQCRIFGHEPDTLAPSYDFFMNAIHKDDRPVVRAALDDVLAGRAPYSVDCRIILEDGTLKHIHCEGKVERGADGKPIRMAGTVQDVTEYKTAEAELHKAKAEAERARGLYERILTTVPSVVYDYILHPDGTSRWLYISPHCKELFEVDAADVMRDSGLFWNMVHPDDLGRVRVEDAAANRNANFFQTEFRICTPSGKTKWLYATSRKNPSHPGAPAVWSGSFLDITGRKRAEEKLLQSEKSLANAQTIGHVGSWEFDLKTGKSVWSDESFRIFGYAPGAFEPTFDRFLGMVHPDDRNKVEAYLPEILSGKLTRVEFDIRTIRPDGQERLIHDQLEVMTDKDGAPVKIFGINYDITDRKRAEMELLAAKEAAENATRLKDKFVSLVAHDLKGPLGALVTYLKQLKRASPAGDTKMIFETAVATGENMMNLIEDLLSASRIKMGKLKPDLKFAPAAYFAVKAVEEFRNRAEQKQVKILNEVPRDARLFADDSLFYEVVRNLVSNAVKFSRPGGTVKIFSPEGMPGAIAVSDEGIGIGPERMEQLFEYETKTSTAGTAGELGTGLGLPLCKDIMEAHDGKLLIQSAKGRGSVFIARLPHVRPRVLVAAGEEDRNQLALQLRELEAEVIACGNGSEALHGARFKNPHLIITDIRLPEMDGFELIGNLKEDSNTASIPVIVISEDQSPDTRGKSFRLGAQDFIAKPLNGQNLAARARVLIGL